MHTRFLLGPAGSGKTFRCLAEIRDALRAAPEGPALVLVAPKQATFQLERQLLADASVQGYTRLHILSFERLARFVLDALGRPLPEFLSEEGRLMVLRALLAEKKEALKIFRSTARLPGFAQELSSVLRELQRACLSPKALRSLACNDDLKPELRDKLHDLALLLEACLQWLQAHQLQDANRLLDLAAEAALSAGAEAKRPLIDALWLDGFAEMTAQEMNLLVAIAPFCARMTLAFCLDHEPRDEPSWLSTWSVVGQTYRQCSARLSALSGNQVSTLVLERDPAQARFAGHPVLQFLEQHWTQSQAAGPPQLDGSLRLVACANPEREAVFAARQILHYVREEKGRFRDVAVLVRQLDGYHDVLRRVFTRYEIPFFLDRREPVAHHPLAELTRHALRVVAFDWQQEDWFGALKSGLFPADDQEVDWLENEAMKRGWNGAVFWQKPVQLPGDPPLALQVERIRRKIAPAFGRFAPALSASGAMGPTGRELAAALRDLWETLNVRLQLEEWSQAAGAFPAQSAVHATVWQQMNDWLGNIERAFPVERLPLREWLPILESGLGALTVGAIPPALDQVLVGTIDRSRNPDLQLCFVLGVNESVFPAPPGSSTLLTDDDRDQLETARAFLGPSARHRLGHERYYGYIACTRARRRLILTCAQFDRNERKLNPSPFFGHVQRLFPALQIENDAPATWREAEHVNEVVPALLQLRRQLKASGESSRSPLAEYPALLAVLNRLSAFPEFTGRESLSRSMVERLHGKALLTSVTHLEQFAACPFRFFVSCGLRAKEREIFEADSRQTGQFQHEVLQRFHEELRDLGRTWHEITPAEARARIISIAEACAARFGEGLFAASQRNRFLARQLTAALADFIEIIVQWMQSYRFEPQYVELEFGTKNALLPAWTLDLGEGHRLRLRGKIDRVDVMREPGSDRAFYVVIDYKSSSRRIDAVLLANSIQIQLPAYLAALRRLSEQEDCLSLPQGTPAGVFYINLRGDYGRAKSRRDVVDDLDSIRRQAYQHRGRFNLEALPWLDARHGEGNSGQFAYRLRNDGEPRGGNPEILRAPDFFGLLDQIEEQLRNIGRAIYEGRAAVDPYRRGVGDVACQQCDYRSICRIDTRTHLFRTIGKRDA